MTSTPLQTLRRFALGSAAALAVGVGASADTVSFSVELSTLAVVPPFFSTAIGTADVELDTLTGEVSVSGSYTNLGGVPTLANLRRAPSFANGPTILDLLASGSPSGTLTGSGVLSAADVEAMLLGETYLLVQTTLKPLGELRGQVRLPSKLALVDGLGLNPPDSLFQLSGGAGIGATLNLGIDNVLGTQASPAVTFLAFSVSQTSILFPGAGMSAPGAVGEVLIFPARYPFPFKVWNGPLNPTSYALAIPVDTTLVGVTIYLQGGIYEPVADHLGLTNGLQVTIGNL